MACEFHTSLLIERSIPPDTAAVVLGLNHVNLVTFEAS
jgi:hypothetical protein